MTALSADAVPVSAIVQPLTVRLIPTRHFAPPVLGPLVDTEEEQELLAELEGLTNRRLKAERGNVPAIRREELVYDRAGQSYVNAAFAHSRKGGNRFNDEARGAWYAGFDVRTALEEVAFHRTRELGYIGHFEDSCRYRALHASFIGRFHDLRGVEPPPACLDADIATGYPAGQELAAALIERDSRGLVYPSVRYEGGTCLVAFQPGVIQDVVPGAEWELRWDGSPDWKATTV
ncbi:MAG: RES family NAD+ phosphorylase [Parasphingopyxis sp.]|uniref:RES family NAD+ phosphorylase n=1 Tax=Parasphingopyxis sp. TaxID=1920299 RepID=UPI003F9F4609